MKAPKPTPRGFALVVTLSLMILLTVIAVGLLTLSSISLRSSSQDQAMTTARANAKLALMLAIGDLQKQLGPDTRISIIADQRTTQTDGSESSSAEGNRQWTGVFRAWPAGSVSRPAPEFLAWLISGDPKKIALLAAAETKLTAADSVELVGKGTLGPATTRFVRVPVIQVAQANSKTARIGWWIGDQGVKAAISTPPPGKSNSLAVQRGNLQGAPRNAIESASVGTSKPFVNVLEGDARLPLVTSWQQASLLATDVAAQKELFHDLASFSTGMLTNVRSGGFRKDLSMQLERAPGGEPKDSLYTVGGESGINLQELWVYYNLYKEMKTSGGPPFTTGGSLPSGAPYLQVETTPKACQSDDEFYLKQPVIISYQLVLSFETRPVLDSAGKTVNRVHVVADPILTFWNPLDVPVVVPTTAYFSAVFTQIPYDLSIGVNGGLMKKYSLAASLAGAYQSSFGVGDGNTSFLSIVTGKSQQLVFKPGEVVKVSQSGNSFVGKPEIRAVDAKSGFNYGGGVSFPLRTLDWTNLDLQSTDTIVYEAKANNLTCGKKGDSGNSISGNNQHSRHFSLIHNASYVGSDSGGSDVSLGIGGIYIDYDFGDKRLAPSESRGTTSTNGLPGTKYAAGSRLYADKFPDIFRPITSPNTRPLTATEIDLKKAPFMILSYNAKTEMNTDLGTRFFSRFNPKALHVDFYDLKEKERDMLPYEFRVDPLTSWKNRSLEVSSAGNAYYGGGLNAEFGSSFITTHTAPREPLISLAAFQHSFANGFLFQKPYYGYTTLNSREPMLPQISHAIGNSMAPSMMEPDKTEGSLPGSRPLADHSYLANRALWDDWFLSGITPQSSKTFSQTIDQKTLASDFLTGKTKLPVARYFPAADMTDAAKILATFFTGTSPNDTATRDLASCLRVDGLFNINSTSTEAWKAVLGGLKGRQVIVRDILGEESLAAVDTETPVANLAAPASNAVVKGTGVDVKEANQWVGRRTLGESEIDSLARAIVKEVRKRGPFLSLADFVNRRVGTDKALARCGAIQSALEADEVKINESFRTGSRAVNTTTASRFDFPEAEKGPMAYGSPGLVKQADILTPIAPVLSARSDSFIIRSYGEALNANGTVTARAWCETVVERDRNFVDPVDKPETPLASLTSGANRTFGRRFQIISFRWLNPAEI